MLAKQSIFTEKKKKKKKKQSEVLLHEVALFFLNYLLVQCIFHSWSNKISLGEHKDYFQKHLNGYVHFIFSSVVWKSTSSIPHKYI